LLEDLESMLLRCNYHYDNAITVDQVNFFNLHVLKFSTSNVSLEMYLCDGQYRLLVGFDADNAA
jgi:hypothetical protein